MRTAHTWIFLVLAGWALAGSAAAQERFSPMLSEGPSLISGNQHFYVSGTNRADMLEIAIWAEAVAERISMLMGQSYPQSAGETLMRIELVYAEEQPVRVEMQQYDSDAGFRQVLLLQNVTKNEQTEALEALCCLILNRYAQPARQKTAPTLLPKDAVPYWLVDGMALHWLPAIRASGREAVLRAWDGGEPFSIEQILRGAWSEPLRSAIASEWFEWLLDRPDAATLFQSALACPGGGGTITGAWLVEQCPDSGTSRDWNQAWSLHLAALASSILAPGAFLPEDVKRLRDSLVILPEMVSVAVQEDVPYTYSLSELIEGRSAPWIPVLTDVIAARIQEASIGRAPALQDVARKYLLFLDAVPQVPAGWWSRLRGRGVTDEALRALLEDADHSLNALQAPEP